MSRFQSLLKPILQWVVNLTFPPSHFQSNLHLAIQANSWTSLDSICSNPSHPILLAILAMFAVKVWICTDSSSFPAVRTGHSFFPAWFQCVWLQFMQLFFYVYNAFCYVKLLPTFHSIHIWITFHIVQYDFEGSSNVIELKCLDYSLVHRLKQSRCIIFGCIVSSLQGWPGALSKTRTALRSKFFDFK